MPILLRSAALVLSLTVVASAHAAETPVSEAAILTCASKASAEARLQCFEAIATAVRAKRAGGAVAANAADPLSQCVAELQTREQKLEESKAAMKAQDEKLAESQAALEQAKITAKAKESEIGIFGLSLGGVDPRGPDDLSGAKAIQVLERDDYGRPRSVQMPIVSTAYTAEDLLLVVLDNGQVWRQLNGRKVILLKSKPPTTARIERGVMGGFTLYLNDAERGVPATRIDKGAR